MRTNPDASIARAAAGVGVLLTPEQVRAMARFLDMLYESNARFNLTRVPRSSADELHIADSLAPLGALRLRPAGRALDIGTGAGLPCIPLAIALPGWHFTALDGTRKKVEFVRAVAEALGLDNVAAVHGRAEEYIRGSACAGSFDLVLARAVAPLPRLVDWMLPFLAKGGRAVAYKTQDTDEELRAAEPSVRRHACRVEKIMDLALPFSGARRRLVVVRRVR